MTIILWTVCFVVYSYVMCNYASNIFRHNKSFYLSFSIITVVNGLLFYFYLMHTTFVSEWLLLIAYAVILTIEFIVFFKTGVMNALFGALSFSVNFISVRLIIGSIYAIINEKPLLEAVNNADKNFLMCLITMSILIPYILVTKYIAPTEFIDMIMSDKKNLILGTCVIGVATLYLAAGIIFRITDFATVENNIFIITFCIKAIIAYLLSLYFSYKFTSLTLKSAKSKVILESYYSKKEDLNSMKKEVAFDSHTGTHSRLFMEETLTTYINNHEEFYVVLLDIDGLKYVNDNYGHAEGDFYIHSCADILKACYDTELVGRIGGDEFLVIGHLHNQYESIKKTMLSFQSIGDIAKNNSKTYPTSISYGITIVTKDNAKSMMDILSECDEKMYKFKQKHKKNRK